VLAEPVLHDIGGAAFQDVGAPAGLGVNQDGRVDEPAAQREIVDLSGVLSYPSVTSASVA
jgi:hypothetical protein